MYVEFLRLRASRVKIIRLMVLEIVMRLLKDEDLPVTMHDIENQTGRTVEKVLTINWVQSFLDTYRIVTRKRTGNRSLSRAQQLLCDQSIAYTLGRLYKSYKNGLGESCVENYGECHFQIDLDDCNCLEFAGKKIQRTPKLLLEVKALLLVFS